MKTWRWTLLLVSSGALAFACSVEDNSTDDDTATTETTTTSSTGGSSSVAASTVSSVSSTSGMQSCAQQPDFDSCVQCFAAEDMAGYQAAIGHIIDNFYCGQTCGAASTGMECQTFCMDTTMQPDMACEDCSVAIDCQNAAAGSPEEADCEGYAAACMADAACIGFIQKVQMCPPPA